MNLRDETLYPQQYAMFGSWTCSWFVREEDQEKNYEPPAEDREIASGTFLVVAVLDSGNDREYVILASVFQSHPDHPEIRCYYDRDAFILPAEEFEDMKWVKERYPHITLGQMPDVLDHLKSAIKQFSGLYSDSPEQFFLSLKGEESRKRFRPSPKT